MASYADCDEDIKNDGDDGGELACSPMTMMLMVHDMVHGELVPTGKSA